MRAGPALVVALAALGTAGSAAGQELQGPACPSKVMAFYYPWYGGPPEYRHWASATADPRFAHDPNRVTDSGSQYPDGVRRDIASTNYPLLGPYDSADPAVIDRHLDWAERAGIDVLVSSWWGPDSLEDGGLGRLLDRVEATGSPVRVAVYLETWALFYGGQLQPSFFLDPRNFSPDARAEIRRKAADWIAYLIRTYGDRRGFFRTSKGNTKAPVVFFYFAGLFFAQEWQEIFADVRERTGRDGFYQADVEGVDPQLQATVFDGIHLYMPAVYSVEGQLSLAARLLQPDAAVVMPGSEVSDRVTVGGDYQALGAEARALGRSWAATVIPGFDDRKIRSPSFVVSRDRGGERTYDFLWREALASHPNWMLITSFNEWHEGSDIEPSVEYSDEFIERTRKWAGRVGECSQARPGSGRGGRAPGRHRDRTEKRANGDGTVSVPELRGTEFTG